MKRRELLSVIKQNGMFSNDLIPKLIEEVQKHSDNEDTETLRNTLRLFIVKLRAKFLKAKRMYSRLEEQESDWLNKDIYATNLRSNLIQAH